jgi:hypothetical protein
MAALRKALRLAPEGADTTKPQSHLATLEAEELIEAGTPDRFLLERAVELDPSNDKAKQLLSSLEEQSVKRQHRSQRYLAAVIVGLLATVAMVMLARRRRPKPSPPPAEQKPARPEPEPESTPTPVPDSDERPTQEVVVDPVAEEAITAKLVDPPVSDGLPTRELDEPPPSDAIETPRIAGDAIAKQDASE